MKLNDIYKKSVEKLRTAGISTPKTDTELLLTHLLKIDKVRLYTDYDIEIPSEKVEQFNEWITRRINYEPVAYIVGEKDFYGLSFKVSKNVLIPRRETEILVETILNKKFKNKKVLDLGTGTGNIAITLKKFNPTLEVTATDISLDAIKIAKENASHLIPNYKVEFIISDMFDNIDGVYDIIVSNPPYIYTEDIPNIIPEVSKYEPHIALDGGKDGLKFYKKIIEGALSHFNQNGYLFLEISPQVADSVVKFLKTRNFNNIEVIKDYSNNDRVISANYYFKV